MILKNAQTLLVGSKKISKQFFLIRFFDVFDFFLRKFLKKVGIQSQREIEQAVRTGVDSGSLSGDEKLKASVLLRVPEAGVEITIEDDIALR